MNKFPLIRHISEKILVRVIFSLCLYSFSPEFSAFIILPDSIPGPETETGYDLNFNRTISNYFELISNFCI